MPLSLPYTFNDGVGNTASGAQVMSNLNAVNAGVAMATGTSFPTVGLIDGQDYYYLASASLGVVWHFKYRSASASSFKWEFVGGAPLYSEQVTGESTSSTTFVALASGLPQVTVPLAGDYLVRHGAQASAGSAVTAQSGISINAATPNAADIISDTVAGVSYVADMFRERVMTSLAVSAVLQQRYAGSAAVATNYAQRFLSITPVRCI